MRNILLVDGENFKGKIRAVFREAGKERPSWEQYDFKGLFKVVCKDVVFDRKVFYFARIKEYAESREKSKQLIEEQRLLKTHLERQGFEVALSGRVRGQVEIQENKKVLIFKEKGVDVRIAVDMVSLACDRKAESIFLASSDSDLQPAIREVKERKVNCIYIGFETLPNKGISFSTGRTILIRNTEVLEFEQVQIQKKK
ncbi:MAG TPA: NYN domain-containing protein [Candidatus Paceibacterota bacterium]